MNILWFCTAMLKASFSSHEELLPYGLEQQGRGPRSKHAKQQACKLWVSSWMRKAPEKPWDQGISSRFGGTPSCCHPKKFNKVGWLTYWWSIASSELPNPSILHNILEPALGWPSEKESKTTLMPKIC
jgi:hypothetical protein